MHSAPRHILNVACLHSDLPVDGWKHTTTGMYSDDTPFWQFVRKTSEGSLILTCNLTSEGWTYNTRVEH